MKKNTEEKVRNQKLELSGVSLDTGEEFKNEAHSLDEVHESGQYKVVGRNVTEDDGFPPARYCNCKDCYIEAHLIVTRNSPLDGKKGDEIIGQCLTFSNKENGKTVMYLRSWSTHNNKGIWSEWQMVATGNVELIKQNNDISEAFTKLSNDLQTESLRAQDADLNLQKSLETVTSNPVIELGGATDTDGKPTDRDDRIRCMQIARNRIQRIVLTKPNANLDLWVQCLNNDGKVVKSLPSLWSSADGPIDIYKLEENISSFNFIFKRIDNTSITADDLTNAKEYVVNILTNYSYLSNYLLTYNNGIRVIREDDKRVYIDPNGFGIKFTRGVYYVADSSKKRTDPYIFDFSSNTSPCYLVVDATKLREIGVRTELSEVVSIKATPSPSDIIIAYYYPSGDDTYIELMGQFATLFKERPNYNDEILFSPEFYAYKWGRINNANGVGTGWYQRFRLMHVSDVHSSWEELQEAIHVANDKVHVLINTGDDSNGTSSSSAGWVKDELAISSKHVGSDCLIPYIQVSGNHDVTGLTKKEYFDIICSTVGRLSQNVMWGDAQNYRTYGYVDFNGTSYEGNFRVIMLDPFDYNDGQFSAVYPFQAAVFSQKQIDWFINTLLNAAASGLNVLTVMHYSFGDADIFNEVVANPDASYCQDAFMIPDIIDAIQKKTTLTKEYPDVKGYNNIAISRDFSSASDLEFVAHLFGHLHSKNHYQCQKADGSKKYDILMLGEAALTKYGNALNKAYREEGTINGIAFSALEFDVLEKAVYRVAYGAYLNYDKSNSERTVKIPYRFEF